MAAYRAEKQPYEPEHQVLEGKVALISGGTTGIGRATAMLLATHGVRVVVFGRHERELHDVLRELEGTGTPHHGMTADQAEEGDILRVFAETRERFGDIDIMVNNAALAASSALEMPYADILYVMRANLLGYLICVREAVAMMRRKGAGHIVNIGSLSAEVREPGSDIYVATKAGIQAISESLRKGLSEEQIKVSLIEPGLVGTNLASEEPNVEQQVARQAQGKMLEAVDLAYAVYYVLTQPDRSNVLELRIAPLQQGL